MQFRPYHHPSEYDGALVVVVEVGGNEPPNLLIVRTGQIVTTHIATLREGVTRMSTARYSDIPAYAESFMSHGYP